MVFAILTYGVDLDQLRSRSLLSRTAGLVYDVLWLPHDAIIRAISNATLIRPGVIPSVLVGSSFLWGCAASALVALTTRPRDRSDNGTPDEARG